MDVTEKDIGDVITALAESFDDELFSKTDAELEEYWFFRWDNSASLEWNVYKFHDMLKLYGNFCRRWEEKKNGICCVVERVRDKYLMPKIKIFTKQITTAYTGAEASCGSREDSSNSSGTSRPGDA